MRKSKFLDIIVYSKYSKTNKGIKMVCCKKFKGQRSSNGGVEKRKS